MIKWNEGLNLGVKVLDDDHKKLLITINELLNAINDDKAQEILEDMLINLHEYAVEHCHREEILLRKCNYKHFNTHASNHKVFITEIIEFKNKYLNSKESISIHEVSIFLVNWLFNHIITDDIPSISAFENAGIIPQDMKKTSLFKKIIKKTTDTFSFTKRIFLSALIPLIGMLILGFIILWNSYAKYDEKKNIANITHIISDINRLAHVLQIERGLSSGYLSLKEDKFKDSLSKQRRILNNTIESFNNTLHSINGNKLSIIQSYIDRFKKDIYTLNHFRKQIDKKETTQDAAINFYTKIIKNILKITPKVAMFNIDRKISSSIATLSSILHYKETLGIKRAYGIMLIETKEVTTKEYVRFMQLLGTQESLLDNFNLTASHTQINTLSSIINSKLSKKINLFEESIKNHNFKEIDSVVWFESMTELIDRLKLFEDNLLHKLNKEIKDSINNDINNLFLWLIYTTIIFTITLFIIYIFEQSSKGEIYKFIEAMKHLATGKRSLRLTHGKIEDEMAQMYEAYEITRQNLLRGDIYTQLYLSQKEKELKNKEMQNLELEEMAFYDPLTGAVNRRKFEELSILELERSSRYKSFLSFLMLDIDHFKSVNDTYGHSVGDEVLKYFTTMCLEMARDLDVVARIGGEEFVVMLPETNSEGAFKFAERFRKKIFNSNLIIEDQTIKLSVSIGIAILDTSIDKDTKTILQRADKALYKAKNSGRNTTIVCN